MRHPRRTDVLLAAAVLALTVFFFVPYDIYLNNMEEFFTGKAVFARYLLLCGAGAWAGLSLAVLGAGRRARVFLLPFLAFLSLAIWTQVNILNWDYGVLDGSALTWRLFERRSVIDAGVWLLLFLVIVIPAVKKKFSCRTLFIILALMQAGGLFIAYLGHKTTAPETGLAAEEVSISLENQFAFSSERNLIILVLDAYQTDVFNEYIERHPEYKELLPGFTYYPDAVAENYFTGFSIPSILTGHIMARPLFPSVATYRRVMNDALLNDSIPALLKKEDYYVGVYTSYAHRYYPPEIYQHIADNYSREEVFTPHYAGEMRRLMAVALFRIVPHALKKLVHERFLLGDVFEQDRDVFMHGIRHSMRIGTNVPCFKYYHLQGIHAPQVIEGEVLNWLERSSTMRITELVNGMLAMFVSGLQRLNIYDTSDILVIADHGLYWDAADIEYGQYEDAMTHAGMPLDIFVKKPRALPLILFKPAHAEGAMTISSAPVALCDIFPTVLEIAGIEHKNSYEGIPLQHAEEGNARVRRYFPNEYRRRLSNPIYEFLISGFSWSRNSWTYTGNVYASGAVERIPLDNYHLGTQLTFGRFGTANQYLVENWLPQDNAHRIDGLSASLSLPLADVAPGMTLHVEVAPAPGKASEETQSLRLYVNDNEAGVFTVAERQTLRVDIPYNPAWRDIEPPVRPVVPASTPWLSQPPPLSDMRATIRFSIQDARLSHAPDMQHEKEPLGLDVYSLRIDAAETRR